MILGHSQVYASIPNEFHELHKIREKCFPAHQ